jgi:broad specificity phosphatase PhoE
MDFIEYNKGANIRKTIHLIRHGQTDFNKENIIQGSGIDSDLNATGRLQAQMFYKLYKDIPYQHIYTSKLKRTIQSVEPFIQKGIPYTALSELNEINWGIMEGRKGSNESNAIYLDMVSKWSTGSLDIAVEGGETPNDMFRRQTEGLKKIMQAGEEQILICMHGRAIRSFLCLLTGTPLKDMEKWQHHNLCLYELEFNGTCFDVIRENDLIHLSDQ